MNLKIVEAELRNRNSLPDDFRFYSWKCFPERSDVTHFIEFKGGCCPLLKTGKNKGRPNYKKLSRKMTFNVTPAEIEAIEADYESETGNCSTCEGKGKRASRISVKNGTEYIDCRRCNGTGNVANGGAEKL